MTPLSLLSLVLQSLGGIGQTPSLSYEAPPAWTRALDPRTGVTSLMPQRLPFGRVCVITVFSPEPFAGPAAAYHDEVVRRATGSARLLEPPQTDSLGGVGKAGFLTTRVHQLMPNGVQLWVTIYTARWGEQGQAFVLSTNALDVARQYAPVAEAMIRGIAVPQVPPFPAVAAAAPVPIAAAAVTPRPPCLRPTGIEICPKAVVPEEPSTAIVGAYLAAAARSSFRVGAGVRSRVTTEILLLFANGVAARSSAMKDGADGTYWAEGFATMDPRDASQLGARRAGRWTERNGTITIAWQIGSPTTLTRDGEKLREEYTVWSPYPPVDELRLEGRYQRRPEEYVSPSGITFHRDGTFEQDGLNVTMGGTVVNPGFPEQGSGTYQISRWSLILRFSTGFVQSINLLLGEGDRANPADLVLNGYDLVRAPPR